MFDSYVFFQGVKSDSSRMRFLFRGLSATIEQSL